MSLVAYGSSDESDSGETSPSAARPSRGLFSVLPAPKKPTAGPMRSEEPASRQTKTTASPHDGPDPQAARGGSLLSLPRPKKRTEPVKITVPKMRRDNSDSDEDEPAKKRSQPQGSGTGLSSLLPQPRNMSVKETNRPLIPYTLTKSTEPKTPRPAAPAKGLLGSSASPSAIKAAAKSAALQLARQIATEDQDNEEDVAPENYFSLGESTVTIPIAAAPSPDPEPRAPGVALPFVPRADDDGQSDAPLDFGCSHEGPGAWGGHPPDYQQPLPDAGALGYYNQPFYQDANPEQADDDDDDEPGSSEMFDEEAFMRLQGKRNRGKEEVKFLEIKGDDQLVGSQQWMTKSMTEEKQERKSFSKKKGDQPTGQQRRKHQITYLIHQAKERELELKNNWAENKLTRRQTQAKYGF
ncbi:Proline-rich protein PRCC [Merluccius polli]|uniref:Proline-rich protein PRCC n=1 Tax=Merluccius polli TaxID=89951 RepID=A0AA47MS58_MERPO|nr:Proline-rich protein PRCC [Merluccius polli]